MEKPKVIFFDAVGTLFGIKGTVGDVYASFTKQIGLDLSPDQLNQAFKKSWQKASSPVFSGVDSQQIPEAEYKWWKDIVEKTFKEVGVFEQIPDFTALFTRIYAHFATADPWEVYPDSVKSLKQWHKIGIELGVISNFDTRLYAVLELLGLSQYFQSITISSYTGSAKPDPRIFLAALEKHNCVPQKAWHIGDSLKEDYEGAKAVGIKAILIERKDPLF